MFLARGRRSRSVPRNPLTSPPIRVVWRGIHHVHVAGWNRLARACAERHQAADHFPAASSVKSALFERKGANITWKSSRGINSGSQSIRCRYCLRLYWVSCWPYRRMHSIRAERYLNTDGRHGPPKMGFRLRLSSPSRKAPTGTFGLAAQMVLLASTAFSSSTGELRAIESFWAQSVWCERPEMEAFGWELPRALWDTCVATS